VVIAQPSTEPTPNMPITPAVEAAPMSTEDLHRNDHSGGWVQHIVGCFPAPRRDRKPIHQVSSNDEVERPRDHLWRAADMVEAD
jgi:hypothetical protein